MRYRLGGRDMTLGHAPRTAAPQTKALRAGIALVALAVGLLLPGTAVATPTPIATTQPATAVTATSATLNGTVNSGGLPATWHFDYATATEFSGGTYPHSTPNSFMGVWLGAGGVPVPTDVLVSS